MNIFEIDNQLFTFDEFCKLKKTRCNTVPELLNDFPILKGHELVPFLEEVWDEVIPLTFQEAMAEPSVERKRIMFFHLGPARLIAKVKDKKILDTYKHSDKQGDTYHLWDINPKELGFVREIQMKAIQCWCPSTNKEYWIFVDHRKDYCTKPNAKDAIAWTCLCPIINPQAIYRQGEVYVFEESKDSVPCDPYHMQGEEYFNLLKRQT